MSYVQFYLQKHGNAAAKIDKNNSDNFVTANLVDISAEERMDAAYRQAITQLHRLDFMNAPNPDYETLWQAEDELERVWIAVREGGMGFEAFPPLLERWIDIHRQRVMGGRK